MLSGSLTTVDLIPCVVRGCCDNDIHPFFNVCVPRGIGVTYPKQRLPAFDGRIFITRDSQKSSEHLSAFPFNSIQFYSIRHQPNSTTWLLLLRTALALSSSTRGSNHILMHSVTATRDTKNGWTLSTSTKEELRLSRRAISRWASSLPPMATSTIGNGPQMQLLRTCLVNSVQFPHHSIFADSVDNWDRQATPMTRDPFGVWSVTLPAVNGQTAIPHNTKVKVSSVLETKLLMQITMTTPQGEHIDRIPAWIKRVTQDLSYSPVYDAVFWNPPKKYIFKNRPPPRPQSVRVYEAHGQFPKLYLSLFQSASPLQSIGWVRIQSSPQMSSLESKSSGTMSSNSWPSWNTLITPLSATKSLVSLLLQVDMVQSFLTSVNSRYPRGIDGARRYRSRTWHHSAPRRRTFPCLQKRPRWVEYVRWLGPLLLSRRSKGKA